MVSNNQEVSYNGFATPCLILNGSDKEKRGSIIDPYAKTKEQDGLLCGEWSKGMDGLIHIYLIKPVAAICNEREEWVAKQTLLKKPISYIEGVEGQEKTQRPIVKKQGNNAPKKQLVLDSATKQFKLI